MDNLDLTLLRQRIEDQEEHIKFLQSELIRKKEIVKKKDELINQSMWLMEETLRRVEESEAKEEGRKSRKGGIRAICAAIAACLMVGTASAHEWYPPTCCGDLDCQSLPRDAVRWTPAGWLILETGEIIPESEAQESPDHQFHRCRRNYMEPSSETRSTGGMRCFWRPGAGS